MVAMTAAFPDQSDLGEVRVDLGKYSTTAQGRSIVALMWVTVVLSVGLLGMSLALMRMILDFSTGSGLVIMGAALVVLSLAVIALGLLGVREVGGSTVTVHDHGLGLRQPWFVRRQIPWATVSALVPPSPQWHSRRFDIALHAGSRQVVTRLNLPPHRAPDGQVIQNPDVQVVLNFFAEWQKRQPKHWA